MRDAAPRRISRAFFGLRELSVATRLVRCAAARAREGGHPARARGLCERLLDVSLALSCFAGWEHCYATFVFRPVLAARKDLVCGVGCSGKRRSEEVGFLNDCLRTGVRIYSVSQRGLVQRRGTTFGHTWDISNTEVLATSTIDHWGPPHETEMPAS